MTSLDLAEILASAALDDPKSKISIDLGDEAAREAIRMFRAGEWK